MRTFLKNTKNLMTADALALTLLMTAFHASNSHGMDQNQLTLTPQITINTVNPDINDPNYRKDMGIVDLTKEIKEGRLNEGPTLTWPLATGSFEEHPYNTFLWPEHIQPTTLEEFGFIPTDAGEEGTLWMHPHNPCLIVEDKNHLYSFYEIWNNENHPAFIGGFSVDDGKTFYIVHEDKNGTKTLLYAECNGGETLRFNKINTKNLNWDRVNEQIKTLSILQQLKNLRDFIEHNKNNGTKISQNEEIYWGYNFHDEKFIYNDCSFNRMSLLILGNKAFVLSPAEKGKDLRPLFYEQYEDMRNNKGETYSFQEGTNPWMRKLFVNERSVMLDSNKHPLNNKDLWNMDDITVNPPKTPNNLIEDLSLKNLPTLKTIGGTPIQEIEKNMYPDQKKYSDEGFLKKGEHLIPIMIEDSTYLERVGLRKEEIVFPLMYIKAAYYDDKFDLGVFRFRGQVWSLARGGAKGGTHSPFPDSVKGGSNFQLKNHTTGHGVSFSGLGLQLAYIYGFFQSPNSEYRMNPKDIVMLFGGGDEEEGVRVIKEIATSKKTLN